MDKNILMLITELKDDFVWLPDDKIIGCNSKCQTVKYEIKYPRVIKDLPENSVEGFIYVCVVLFCFQLLLLLPSFGGGHRAVGFCILIVPFSIELLVALRFIWKHSRPKIYITKQNDYGKQEYHEKPTFTQVLKLRKLRRYVVKKQKEEEKQKAIEEAKIQLLKAYDKK